LEIGELDFPGSRSIFTVKRVRTNKKSGTSTEEQLFYISNLVDPSPQSLLEVSRMHWTIESLHHMRDVTGREDAHTLRTGNGPLVMTALRSFAISMRKILGLPSMPELIDRAKTITAKLLQPLQSRYA
jgi:hypothetical protein